MTSVISYSPGYAVAGVPARMVSAARRIAATMFC
jgi:hypothetical protein